MIPILGGIGFVGGMVGLILGVLRFPFIIGPEISISVATGTNIGVSTMAVIPGAVRHFRQKNVNIRIFLTMAITGAIGSLLTRYIPIALSLSFIGIIISYEAFVLIRGKSERKSEKTQTENNDKVILIESLIGFGIGFLGGLVGLILGSIRLPTMISILKMKPTQAVGTNLAASSVICVSALVGHLLNNEVDFLVLLVMGYDWWIYWSKIYSTF